MSGKRDRSSGSNGPAAGVQILELAVKEFFQSRRFSNLNYAPGERIEINLLLTINSQPAADRFEGSLQVIYARPVFGTDYNTPILDLVDNNIQFNFLENTQVEFTPDRHINNLSSVLRILCLLHPRNGC